MNKVIDDVKKLYFLLGITAPYEIDLKAIASHQGARVKYEPLHGCEARIIGYDDRAIITLNSDSIIERQKFSLGHEIGHWLKDRGRIGNLCSQSEINEFGAGKKTNCKHSHRENIANTYASELLIPHSLLSNELQSTSLNLDLVSSISSTFGTSLIASARKIIQSEQHVGFLAMYDLHGNRKWFKAHSKLPYSFLPPRTAPDGSGIKKIITRQSTKRFSDVVDGDVWCKDSWADDCTVHEEAVHYHNGDCLVLVWWQNEEPVWEAICSAEGIIEI